MQSKSIGFNDLSGKWGQKIFAMIRIYLLNKKNAIMTLFSKIFAV